MILTQPSMEYDERIRAFRRDFIENDGSEDGCGSMRRFDETRDWLDYVEKSKRLTTATPEQVPTDHYIFVRETDGKIVGVIQIRRLLNESLEKYGGHIGYSVCPSERRKGYATQMLRAALQKCRESGLGKVLLTCSPDNEGSRRVILNNGGIFESVAYDEARSRRLERYWIDISDEE